MTDLPPGAITLLKTASEAGFETRVERQGRVALVGGSKGVRQFAAEWRGANFHHADLWEGYDRAPTLRHPPRAFSSLYSSRELRRRVSGPARGWRR